VLHRTISAIRAETWEQINRTLLASAREIQLERGQMVRLDSTVTAALIHEPSDSSLLWDAVRVMVRLLREAEAWAGRAGLAWRDHRRAAKKRARDMQFTRGRPRRVQLNRELIRATRATLAYLLQAAAQLTPTADPVIARWQAKVEHYRPLIERIIAQTEQRVLAGQPVPAGDKLVSLFEPHADIIRKGREVGYGHKLNLITGPSGLILDLVIETGNPADSARLLLMLERHHAFYGRPPRQAATDGSYASHDNLRRAKACGLRDMAFPRRAASASKTWSEAAGSIASSGTSVPASKPTSPASNEPMVWRAALGAGSTASGPTSGPRWWPTTSRCSPASSPPEAISRHRCRAGEVGQPMRSRLPPAPPPSPLGDAAAPPTAPKKPPPVTLSDMLTN
jgi:transposase, IS5 family